VSISVRDAREEAAAGAGVRRKGRLRVDLADAAFADAVVRDLNGIRRTAAGRALFRDLGAAGCSVHVVRPDPPTDPPNAWTRMPDPDGTDATILVVYDPADWPGPSALGGLPSDVILFGRLVHALAIVTGTFDLVHAAEAISPAMAAYLQERTDR
jgi:hypothetical protein